MRGLTRRASAPLHYAVRIDRRELFNVCGQQLQHSDRWLRQWNRTVSSTPTGISCSVTNGAAGATGCSATFSSKCAQRRTADIYRQRSERLRLRRISRGSAPPALPPEMRTTIPSTSSVGAVFSGPPVPFAGGSVPGRGNMVFVLDPTTGKPVQVLKDFPAPGGSWCRNDFSDSVGNLYVAQTTGYLTVFNKQAAGPTVFGNNGGDDEGYSVVIDPSGNALLAELFITNDEQPTLLQFAPGTSPTGTPTATYYPGFDTSNPGSFWVEVLDSGDTVAYTLGGTAVGVGPGRAVQHPDIVPNPALTTGEALYALRELPDESLLVAASDRIIRMSQSGTIAQSYKPGGGMGVGSAIFQNLNLDPDGVSFWTTDARPGPQ